MVRLIGKFGIPIVHLERWVWYAFLATVAWQTRVILWQADIVFWEWRSASFWFSDALVVALFVLAVARGWRPRLTGFDRLLLLVFAAAGLSLFNATHLGIGLYTLIRLAECVLLYLYVRQWAVRRFDADLSVAWFVAGALTQGALAIAQFYLQHDVGLRWVGETLLRTDMRGVAVFYDLARDKVLRAYGTLPHPNVLAAYLMLALWGLAWLWLRHADNGEGRTIRHSAFAVSGVVLLWAMLATFSRTMIFAWVAATAIIMAGLLLPRISRAWPNIATIRRRMIPAAVLVAVVALWFVALHWEQVMARLAISADEEAVQLRVRYAQDAVASGGGWGIHLNVNWTGVGTGNFTSWLMEWDPSLPRYLYQPAHNIYLLSYAETGLIGVLLWLAWLVFLCRRSWRAHADQPALRLGIMVMLGALFFIGLFDHFFMTLQQGRLLWWLSLAIAAGPVASESYAPRDSTRS